MGGCERRGTSRGLGAHERGQEAGSAGGERVKAKPKAKPQTIIVDGVGYESCFDAEEAIENVDGKSLRSTVSRRLALGEREFDYKGHRVIIPPEEKTEPTPIVVEAKPEPAKPIEAASPGAPEIEAYYALIREFRAEALKLVHVADGITSQLHALVAEMARNKGGRAFHGTAGQGERIA
jgi:hypothetical protein